MYCNSLDWTKVTKEEFYRDVGPRVFTGFEETPWHFSIFKGELGRVIGKTVTNEKKIMPDGSMEREYFLHKPT